MTTQFDLTGTAQALAEQALATLADVMQNGKDRDRVAAAKEVLARGHGNVYTQAAPSTLQSQIAQQLAGLSDDQLLAIAQAARGQLAVPIVGQSVSPIVGQSLQGEGGRGQNEGPQAGGIGQGTLKANFRVENNGSATQNSQVENNGSATQNAEISAQVENTQSAQRNKPAAKRPRGRPRKQQPKPVDNLLAEEDDLLT